MEINVPRIMLAAPASGSGKTVITCGLLRALQKRGMEPVSFKCGPDYIDVMFHQTVLGIAGCNLDSFFLQEEELRALFARKSARAPLAVIEGVMGYYDGVAGISTQASSYEIARMTKTPVILVVDGKRSSLSLAALVQGFRQFREDSYICGVILNRTSEMMAKRLQPILEEQGVVLLGAVPDCEEARLESRHLGLILPQTDSWQQLDRLAEKLALYLDLEQILKIAGMASPLLLDEEQMGLIKPVVHKKLHRIGVARDEAFCFYYQENLDFLMAEGYEVIPFSPLHDQKLPAQLDALLLGGGYPELYARPLSENIQMLQAIRQAAADGVKIMAECGGFLYLHESLEDDTGQCWPLVGIIEARGMKTERLSRFGYIELVEAGSQMKIRAHEFHYWDSTAPGTAMLAAKPASDRSWNCMHYTENLLVGFPHLYYLSNPAFIRQFLNQGGDDRCCN